MPASKAPQPTPAPDLYGPQPNPGYAPDPPHGSPARMHPEQTGWLVELAAAAAADPENVAKLASVVHELVRMIRHFDVKSDSRGLPR